MTGAIPPSKNPIDTFVQECEDLNAKIDESKLRIEKIEPAFKRIKTCFEAAISALETPSAGAGKSSMGTSEGLSKEHLETIYRTTCEKLLKEDPTLHLEITTPLLKSESPLLLTPSPKLHHDISNGVMLDWELTTLINSQSITDPKLGTYGLEQSLNCLLKLQRKLENEIRDLKESPELTPLLEELTVKTNLLKRKIAEIREKLPDLIIKDDAKFIPEPDNPFYNAIIDDRITFHMRNLEILNMLAPSSPEIPKLKSNVAYLKSIKTPKENPPEKIQEIFCRMNNLNKKCASLWRHLGFQKNFSHLTHFEKEHLAIALLSDIRAIQSAIRDAKAIDLDRSIASVFTTEVRALEATFEALNNQLIKVDEAVNRSKEENNKEIRSFLLSREGSPTFDKGLRESIESHLDFS